jgi:hypothetical protein
MKSLLESINESTTKTTFYAIKFVAGKNKGSYLGSDSIGYVVADLNFEDRYSHKALVYSNINDVREDLEYFNGWAKGLWGEAAIAEISMNERIVK